MLGFVLLGCYIIFPNVRIIFICQEIFHDVDLWHLANVCDPCHTASLTYFSGFVYLTKLTNITI